MNSSNDKSILVTGGAGYIGSHTTHQLLEAGYRVVVLDNLYSGHRWAVPDVVEFVEGDAGNIDLVRTLIREHAVVAVIHFAGHIVVPESVADPLKYYKNNTSVSRNLIEACVSEGVERFVFSSSAAVYGMPNTIPVSEDAETNPINPYGASKLMTEWMLRDVANASTEESPFRYVALRYFNVAGARLDGTLGQATPEATHLIKVACQAACGKRDKVFVFGADYDTPDGTCIRDFIHVEDLARAHLDALGYLARGGTSEVLNCGYGHGYSVREVLETVKRVSGADFDVQMAGRRRGDPAVIVAGAERINHVLGWAPKLDDIEVICDSALQWERASATRQPA